MGWTLAEEPQHGRELKLDEGDTFLITGFDVENVEDNGVRDTVCASEIATSCGRVEGSHCKVCARFFSFSITGSVDVVALPASLCLVASRPLLVAFSLGFVVA